MKWQGMLLLLVLTLVGCKSTPKLTEAQIQEQQQQDVVMLANRASNELEQQGQRYPDADYQRYLNQLLARLTSDEERNHYQLQVFLSSNPLVNAFALPNGHIYLQLGLLAAIDNEAELAFILAHEIEHVVQEHGRIGRQKRSKTVMSAHILDLITFGTGLAYIPAVGTLSNHSQALELQADSSGVERWQQAGFSHPDVTELFARLNNGEVPRSQWLAYQSHPDDDERKNAILPKLLSTTLSDNPPRFEQELRRVRRTVIEMKLKRRLFLLAQRDAQHQAPQWRNLYQAESWLGLAQYPKAGAREQAWLNDEDVDDLVSVIEAKREDYLNQAQALMIEVANDDETYVRSQRILGDVYRIQGTNDAALLAYQRYLALSQDAAKQAYVKALIKTL